jgi:para-aminobenzoate synthetase component 1
MRDSLPSRFQAVIVTSRSSLSLLTLPYSAHSAHWFQRVRQLGCAVWLDSAWPHSRRGRYDIISAAPLAKLERQHTDPFSATQQLLAAHLPATVASHMLPFAGGAIGLFGYEVGRKLEQLPHQIKSAPDFPDSVIGIYSWAIVVDHALQTTTLVLRPETPPTLRAQILACVENDYSRAANPFALTGAWRDEFAAADYTSAFARLQDYIRAGDCYQVNLARRFSAAFDGDPFSAYLRLREIAAAPFSAYLDYETGAVLSLSPERFLAAANGELLTQPIKGTAPRSADPLEDQQLAARLQHSEKNRAENLMIVDLLRNDFGRSCKPGSIRVKQLFELQSFATVHHLVSSIRGKLRSGLHPLDALRHCFPGGSITGAPKIRAMQIIDELEPHARSVFCGAIGYVDVSGAMDTNITIRTLLACRQTLYAWAGGGIVADSRVDDELKETRDKIDPLLRALENPP